MKLAKIKPRLRQLLNRVQAVEHIPRLIVWCLEVSVVTGSGLTAFLLRFDFSVPIDYRPYFLWALPIWLISKAVMFRLFGLDRGWWRFVSVHDLFRISASNFLGSAVGGMLIFVLGPRGFPRSLYVLDFLICFLVTSGVRVCTRIIQDSLHEGEAFPGQKAVLIYGAGAAGVVLLREIRSNPALNYRVIGLVDDNPHKRGIVIQGAKVLGAGTAVPALVVKHKIEEILIAMPSASGPQMTGILRHCYEAGVSYKTVPGLAEIIESNGLAAQIREVAVEDLLGRKQVHLEEPEIRKAIEGKVILVTGAAGSIGSELCRQIARFRPAAIVGFEIAESPLFEIDREMRKGFPETAFYPEIGSVQNRARLDEVLRRYSPRVVYHAAAYKHVPLMETHAFEAVENNIFGTYNVARASVEYGVEEFVMISSDKAVRPSSIMGATKRVAELLLLALHSGRTKFVTVRFGNVLGSNGSVVPIFKKQIAAGGPITVTDPEMRRFFMTIPEACQLVIQAGVIGDAGQICVLDMGEAVKIVDLARNLVLLSGLRPDDDIRIEFTGIRPGEKLREELSTIHEDTLPTCHDKIRIYVGSGIPAGELLPALDQLREMCSARDLGGLIIGLKEIVQDYSPSAGLLKRSITPKRARAVSSAAAG